MSVRRRVGTACADFRGLFPKALCYARIVPVDEVVTLNLFYREDDQLQRLMLDEPQKKELDRLWDELLVISQEPLELVDVYEQLLEYAPPMARILLKD
jgi:RNAse (barnase) inhibitor barstar